MKFASICVKDFVWFANVYDLSSSKPSDWRNLFDILFFALWVELLNDYSFWGHFRVCLSSIPFVRVFPCLFIVHCFCGCFRIYGFVLFVDNGASIYNAFIKMASHVEIFPYPTMSSGWSWTNTLDVNHEPIFLVWKSYF